MKKFLSIVAVLAMVLALSVSAFAATPTASVVAPVDASATTTALSGVTSGKAAEGQTEEVFELKVNDGAYTGEATVAFVYDRAGDVVAVYVQNADGAWDAATIDSVEGDVITVTFPHLSPVSFILKATTPSGGNTPKGNAGGGKSSPQTGYNTILWSISAAAMALCAGYFFVARRKVAE